MTPRGTTAAKAEAKARHTLYLVRHAIAAERSDKYPDDTRRPLTRKGITRMRETVRGFGTFKPGIDLVLTSPLVRARQTADILIDGLSQEPAIDTCLALAPGHSPAEVAAALSQVGNRRVIALVGHEPDLGQLGAWLIGAHEPLVFKKGSIARIDVPAFPPARDGQLVWLATPRMLRALSEDKP